MSTRDSISKTKHTQQPRWNYFFQNSLISLLLLNVTRRRELQRFSHFRKAQLDLLDKFPTVVQFLSTVIPLCFSAILRHLLRVFVPVVLFDRTQGGLSRETDSAKVSGLVVVFFQMPIDVTISVTGKENLRTKSALIFVCWNMIWIPAIFGGICILSGLFFAQAIFVSLWHQINLQLCSCSWCCPQFPTFFHVLKLHLEDWLKWQLNSILKA